MAKRGLNTTVMFFILLFLGGKFQLLLALNFFKIWKEALIIYNHLLQWNYCNVFIMGSINVRKIMNATKMIKEKLMILYCISLFTYQFFKNPL